MTKPVTIEVPENATSVVGVDAAEFGHELLVAAVLRWFEEGRLSQGQAAEMLGLKRGAFFDLLYEHKVSPIQMSVEDLEEDFRRG
jgi:predicted HTH domain antitoxin